MDKLNPTEKAKILKDHRAECLKNSKYGICMMIGKEVIYWDIEAHKYNYRLLAYTKKGIVKLKYNFGFTFDEHLCALFDKISAKILA